MARISGFKLEDVGSIPSSPVARVAELRAYLLERAEI